MHGPVATGEEGGRVERFFKGLLDPNTTRAHYWAAIGAVGLLFILRWGLHPWLLDRAAFVIFIPAVLVAAGHRVGRRREWPAGLTSREVEVLRLVARGLPNRETARLLSISAKTAAHHIQHIYSKIGVSTRGAAALFAMQHGLLADSRLDDA